MPKHHDYKLSIGLPCYCHAAITHCRKLKTQVCIGHQWHNVHKFNQNPSSDYQVEIWANGQTWFCAHCAKNALHNNRKQRQTVLNTAGRSSEKE
jgi:hypothetical protein